MKRLRLSADFNSRTVEGWYCALHHGGSRLDDVAEELGVREGMPVTVYNDEPGDEFEFDGFLGLRPSLPPPAPQWVAIIDDSTFRPAQRSSTT